MKILIDLAALQQVRWYEHLARFVMGGIITVLAGLIAKAFGAGGWWAFSGVSGDLSGECHIPG